MDIVLAQFPKLKPLKQPKPAAESQANRRRRLLGYYNKRSLITAEVFSYNANDIRFRDFIRWKERAKPKGATQW